jgi:hypothetical protein
VDLGALATEVLESALLDVARRQPTSSADADRNEPCPAELTGILGRWWSEAEETIFTWHDGALHAHLSDRPTSSRTVFGDEGDDQYRATAGRLKGERLSILRDRDGLPSSLEWAAYPYTRFPR